MNGVAVVGTIASAPYLGPLLMSYIVYEGISASAIALSQTYFTPKFLAWMITDLPSYIASGYALAGGAYCLTSVDKS